MQRAGLSVADGPTLLHVNTHSHAGVRRWGKITAEDCLPKEAGGDMLRILLGELTVVVVSMCVAGTAIVVGGMTLTDTPGEKTTGGYRLTDAPAGIMLTDALGDMHSVPPTDMAADAPSYTERLSNQPACCCCRCCCVRTVVLLPATMEALPPASMVALPPCQPLAPCEPYIARSNSALSIMPSWLASMASKRSPPTCMDAPSCTATCADLVVCIILPTLEDPILPTSEDST